MEISFKCLAYNDGSGTVLLSCDTYPLAYSIIALALVAFGVFYTVTRYEHANEYK